MTCLVIESVEVFRKALDAERGAGRRVGLVPTMGALHEGHLSLVRWAAAECDAVAVTVFVNPLQFGPGEDLERYPRDLDGDAALASEAGATHLFAPPVPEMYPGEVLTSVRVARLGEGLEEAARPGHLAGVATVVAKLFAVTGPCRAYFGEKDYQQLLVVGRLAADLSFPVTVLACPTVRAADGVALSSRNAYLSADERRAAGVLYRCLVTGRRLVEAGEEDPAVVTSAMAAVVASEPRARLDYAEVRAAGTLERLDRLGGDLRLLVAARLGPARLVDNIGARAPRRPGGA